MNQMVKFGLVLGLICFVASLVLAVTYEVTKPKIEQQLSSEEKAALNEILPQADSFTPMTVDGIEYFQAKRSGRPIGYCVRVVANGYSGFIRMVVGIDASGTIQGVRVLEQYETPGLGARINEVNVGEDEPWFLRQFKGKSVNAIEVKKDIDAITGATISSKAVAEAINKTVNELLAKVNQ